MSFNDAFKYLIVSSLAFAATGMPALAQTFPSGSTGSDLDLTYTTPGTYTFDPRNHVPPLNPANDGIFNFTTITIAAGVTLQLKGNVLNAPVVWLAQGAVQINGTIDISGQNGFNAANTTQRTYTIPGAGGYGGGYPGIGSSPPGAGSGPAGGAIANCNPAFGAPGGITANQFLVPLVGGSGGGGTGSNSGGAGGGAILIASSVSISGAGSIKANGGASSNAAGVISGAGAGGAIRLVAPAVSITGALNVAGGVDGACVNSAPDGIVRVEGFQIGALSVSGTLYTATPFGLFISPTGIPAVTVVSVGGNPVAPNPTGTFVIPDVTVNSGGPLSFVIQGANVPVGTVVTLTIFSENGPDQTIQSTPLAGTLAASTATASATLPSGFSKGFVKASF
jgi:hypothetical protein